jgi:hypothetical protein
LQKAIISKLKSNQREDLDAAVAEMMASKFYFLEVMVEKENNVFPCPNRSIGHSFVLK